MVQTAYVYIIIFLTGMLGIWKAVPVGFALGANPVSIWLFTVLGSSVTVLLICFFGIRIRKYLQKKTNQDKEQRRLARARGLFDKYGVAGLGVIGCLLLGPNMTMLIGMIIVNSIRKLVVYTLIGILLWTTMLTFLAMYSVDLFHRLTV